MRNWRLFDKRERRILLSPNQCYLIMNNDCYRAPLKRQKRSHKNRSRTKLSKIKATVSTAFKKIWYCNTTLQNNTSSVINYFNLTNRNHYYFDNAFNSQTWKWYSLTATMKHSIFKKRFSSENKDLVKYVTYRTNINYHKKAVKNSIKLVAW